MLALSVNVPRRQAETTPLMTPIRIEMIVPAMIIGSVLSSGCLMSSQTGRLFSSELPRLPCSRLLR